MSARTKSETLHVEVVQLRPALLRDRDAAGYLARSPSWIRAQRAADVRAQREGREPSGPAWITIGASVFYELRSLDVWVAANAKERGVVQFSNRGGVPFASSERQAESQEGER